MVSRCATTASTIERACCGREPVRSVSSMRRSSTSRAGALAEVGLEHGLQAQPPAVALSAVPIVRSRPVVLRLGHPTRRRRAADASRHGPASPPSAVARCRGAPARAGPRAESCPIASAACDALRDARPGRLRADVDREADHPALGPAVGDEHRALDTQQRRATEALVVELARMRLMPGRMNR